MKSENSESPLSFVENNSFVKTVVIHNKNKTSYFPGMVNNKKPFFEQIVQEIKKDFSPNHHFFIYTLNEYIYARMKNKIIYICECNNNVSVSQVKIEFNTFIEDMQSKSKLPKFLTSLFDR